jgi:hypothetical protein
MGNRKDVSEHELNSSSFVGAPEGAVCRSSVIATFRSSTEAWRSQGREARAPAGLGLDSSKPLCYQHKPGTRQDLMNLQKENCFIPTGGRNFLGSALCGNMQGVWAGISRGRSRCRKLPRRCCGDRKRARRIEKPGGLTPLKDQTHRGK